MNDHTKFHLQCNACGTTIDGFAAWFRAGQRCPACGSGTADVRYHEPVENVARLIDKQAKAHNGMWHYFDVLPLNDRANIVTGGEGIVPIDRWEFLEEYARSGFGLSCKVFAHRHDDNYPTGTFKDLTGSMVASVLKEIGVKEYVVASTGNIAVACSRYLNAAGVSLYAFIPGNSSPAQEAEIACFGQRVFRVKGDYTRTKEFAQEFSTRHGMPLAAGNFDPMRIEAKKTMLLEWLRLLDDVPTVYIQALSGGTGPLAIAKGWKDIAPLGLMPRMPRFLLVQSDRCSPMADAWEDAKAKGFPNGWEKTYPIYHDPETMIPTLATGYPKTYPALSPLVRESGGEIFAFAERETVLIARLVAFKRSVRMGPAAAIVVGGFIKALRRGDIRDGDVVLLNIGEGIRRAPEFMERMIEVSREVDSVDECSLADRKGYEKRLWDAVERADF
jgi:threonine synthase